MTHFGLPDEEFRKVVAGVSEPLYILWSPNGDRAPTVVYKGNLDEMKAEAERLAKKTNGPIYIMRSVSVCAPAEPPIKWFDVEEGKCDEIDGVHRLASDGEEAVS